MAALIKMPERPQIDHLSIHKLLVPIVFVDASRHIIKQAAWLARCLHAEIILLHVVAPFTYPASMFEAGDEITARDLTSRVVSQAQRDLDYTLPPELDGVAVTRVILRGDPAREIVKAAFDRNVDLIMMSTRGHSAFYRFLLGSVTAKVLHETDCPVWTGAHLEDPAAGEFAVRNVLCSVDLSYHSYRTAALAAQLAISISGALTFVHITESVKISGPGGSRIDPAWKETIVGFATKEMNRLQHSVGTKAEVIIDSGNVLQLMSEAAERTKADLLVIGHSAVYGHLGDN